MHRYLPIIPERFSMAPLKICFVASEIVPFAKTGGLADVSGALGKYLKHRGHDIRMFMPFYDILNFAGQKVYPVDFIQNVPVEFGGFTVHFSALTTKLPGTDTEVYFIHSEGLYNRGKIYTNHEDEYLRFALLSRAALECCQRMAWAPDILHTNDWHTALAPLYMKTLYNWDQLFAATKTALTIHNIGYQGVFSAGIVDPLKLGEYRHRLPQDDLAAGRINFMKIGLLESDVITTVSHTYAQEIKTPEGGAGLDGILRMRSDRLVGILNGVDYHEWSPEKDPYIPYQYSIDNLSGKRKNKQFLLEQMGLPYAPTVPVYGIVSRLTPQKGFELLHEILFDFLVNYDVRFVVLGSGEARYTNFFISAQHHFPGKLCFYNGYNIELSHLIEAGSDMFVMPSLYEPCGLNQIYSLRYGTVPIVRKTGGLADTVQLYDWVTQTGTGFVFEHFSGASLHWAMDYAYNTYQNQEAWEKLMRNGMRQNYSWEVQIEKYIDLYQRMRGW